MFFQGLVENLKCDVMPLYLILWFKQLPAKVFDLLEILL